MQISKVTVIASHLSKYAKVVIHAIHIAVLLNVQPQIYVLHCVILQYTNMYVCVCVGGWVGGWVGGCVCVCVCVV